MMLFSLWAQPVYSYEIYSLVKKDCSVHSGFVVHLEESQIHLLNLSGKREILNTIEINSILVYNVVSDPIVNLDINENINFLRRVTVGDDPEVSFLAWPIRFMDSLVMFYDEEGKTHVFEMDTIHKLRFVNKEDGQVESKPKLHLKAISPNLELERATIACPAVAQVSPQKLPAIRPTRVLSDQIKIQQLIQDLEANFRELESFQERTFLYAKPYLYDKDDRFGFNYFPNRHERAADLPIYMQWTTGNPYRFQSSNVIGSAVNEFGPNVEPYAQIRSELKAHIFHALFVGNLSGLSEGSSLFATQGFDSNSVVKDWGQTESQLGLNYMALIGGDYGPYSVSLGSFFPSIGIRSGKTYREILSTRISYALRLMRTTKSWRIRAVGSLFHFDSHSPSESEIRTDSLTSYTNYLTQFDFKGSFLRAGVDYQYKSLKASADYTISEGDYSELGPSGSLSHWFGKSAISLSLKNEFESTVALGGLLNINNLKTRTKLSGTSADDSSSDVRFGGTLEFLF